MDNIEEETFYPPGYNETGELSDLEFQKQKESEYISKLIDDQKKKSVNVANKAIKCLTFNEDGLYTGLWEFGKPNGSGIMQYNNGEIYEGEFKDGKFHGVGVFKYSSGLECYVGCYNEGLRHGFGVSKFPNGDIRREGNYENGKYLIVSSNLIEDLNQVTNKSWKSSTGHEGVYTGGWENDLPNGIGTFIYPKGESYSGGWLNGKRHGKGIEKFANNVEWHNGEFLNDQRHGYGIGKDKDGKIVHDGKWDVGVPVGKVEKKDWKSSTGHEGVYTGGWENDKPSGYGIFTYPKGETYTGYWKNGKRHGKGIECFANGVEWHNGEFFDDKRHGYGIGKKNDGTVVHDGQWKDGNSVKP